MVDYIDGVLIQLDFSPEELSSVETRGFWYIAIGVMAATLVGLAGLNLGLYL